jgi:hypothetical protein
MMAQRDGEATDVGADRSRAGLRPASAMEHVEENTSEA